MRKSQVVKKDIKGNVKKYEAYREAWTRIKQAIENGFFIEAITIQESIISDRIISFLTRPGASNAYARKKETGNFVSFHQIIKCWRSEFTTPLQAGVYIDLIDAVDKWRRNRNEAVHAIVKIGQNDESQTIDIFLQQANRVAEEGELLAREVCKWQQKSKRSNYSP